MSQISETTNVFQKHFLAKIKTIQKLTEVQQTNHKLPEKIKTLGKTLHFNHPDSEINKKSYKIFTITHNKTKTKLDTFHCSSGNVFLFIFSQI